MTLQDKFVKYIDTTEELNKKELELEDVASKKYNAIGKNLTSDQAQMILDQNTQINRLALEINVLIQKQVELNDMLIKDLNIVNAYSVNVNYEDTSYNIWVAKGEYKDEEDLYPGPDTFNYSIA